MGDQTSNAKKNHNIDICAKLTPFWQYKTGDLRMYFSPTFTWERFTRQQKTLLTASPFVYLNQKIDFRRELTFYTGYNTSTGSPTSYAIDQYRRSYRSWYTSADIVPINRSLYGKLSYDYKRPITEAFFSVSINASRY